MPTQNGPGAARTPVNASDGSPTGRPRNQSSFQSARHRESTSRQRTGRQGKSWAPLPDVVPVDHKVFADASETHEKLCRYIYKEFRPANSEQELRARLNIVQKIETLIQQWMPAAYLTLFGSSLNGFALTEADLDICLKFRDKEVIDRSMNVRDIILSISRILRDHPDFRSVRPIPHAKVPIVKFHYDPFDVDGDISLYNVLAEHNTAMLKAYSSIDERVVPLGVAFKKWAEICGMNDPRSGGLTSYARILMVIQYLQKENVVPVLQELPPIGHPVREELPRIMVEGWNAYYFEDIDRLKETWPLLGSCQKTVGQLWLGLIEYYAIEFRFDSHVVSVRQREPLTKLEKNWSGVRMCIEDPFKLDRSVGIRRARMARLFFSALIKSRSWFLQTPERALRDARSAYEHFMNRSALADTRPPRASGCKRCQATDHATRACPFTPKRGAGELVLCVGSAEGQISIPPRGNRYWGTDRMKK